MIKVPFRAVAAMAVAFPITIVVLLAGIWLLRVYCDNIAYPAYMGSLELGQGSIGAPPAPDTPLASSISESEGMDSFYMEARIRYSSYEYIDGRIYYEVETQNSGSFLARINPGAVEELERPWSRTPVGRWEPFSAEESGQISSAFIDVRDAYVDMLGDYGQVMTEGEFYAASPAFRAIGAACVILLLVLYVVFILIFRKKGWF